MGRFMVAGFKLNKLLPPMMCLQQPDSHGNVTAGSAGSSLQDFEKINCDPFMLMSKFRTAKLQDTTAIKTRALQDASMKACTATERPVLLCEKTRSETCNDKKNSLLSCEMQEGCQGRD